MNKNPLAQVVSLAAISLGFSGTLAAQETSSAAPPEPGLIEEVVTTGTPGGAQYPKTGRQLFYYHLEWR